MDTRDQSPREFFTTIGNTILHVVIEGEGKPLIFLPGWLGYKNAMSDHLCELIKHYRIISLDFQIASSKTDGHAYDLDFYAHLVHEFMTMHNLSDIPIVGMSFGALIGLKYAEKENNLAEKLIIFGLPMREDNKNLIKSVLKYLHSMYNFEKSHNLTLSKIGLIKRIQDWAVPPVKCTIQEHTNPHDNIPLGSAIKLINTILSFNVKNICDKIRIPVMIIHGEMDFAAPSNEIKNIGSSIKNSIVHIMPDTHHSNYFCGNPKIRELEEFLIDFLNQEQIYPQIALSQSHSPSQAV